VAASINIGLTSFGKGGIVAQIGVYCPLGHCLNQDLQDLRIYRIENVMRKKKRNADLRSLRMIFADVGLESGKSLWIPPINRGKLIIGDARPTGVL